MSIGQNIQGFQTRCMSFLTLRFDPGSLTLGYQFSSVQSGSRWHLNLVPEKADVRSTLSLSMLSRVLPSKCDLDHVASRPQKRGCLLRTGTGGGGEGGRGRESEGSTADTARKRPERPWTAARTMEVLRRCPLAIAQRLVHRTIAVSTAVSLEAVPTLVFIDEGPLSSRPFKPDS